MADSQSVPTNPEKCCRRSWIPAFPICMRDRAPERPYEAYSHVDRLFPHGVQYPAKEGAMSGKKYAQHIMKEPTKDYLDRLAKMGTPRSIEEQRKKGNYFESTYMFHLDDKVLPGGFYTDCHWITAIHGDGGMQTEIAHTHDFGETLGFLGCDPHNPRDLGGEIELWLEDEQYTITESCLIFVPAGMKHLPLVFNRVDRAFFFWTASDSKDYGRTSGNEF